MTKQHRVVFVSFPYAYAYTLTLENYPFTMRFSTVFALALGAVPLVSADFNYGVYNCISEGGGYYRSGMIVPAKKGEDSLTSVYREARGSRLAYYYA